MNVLNRMILEDYKKNRDSFLKLEQVVDEMLQNIVKLSGIKEIMGITRTSLRRIILTLT